MSRQIEGDAERPVSDGGRYILPIRGRSHETVQQENLRLSPFARDLVGQVFRACHFGYTGWPKCRFRARSLFRTSDLEIASISPSSYGTRYLFEDLAVQGHVLLAVGANLDQGR